jgi:hypothetical protein
VLVSAEDLRGPERHRRTRVPCQLLVAGREITGYARPYEPGAGGQLRSRVG